MPGYIYVVLIFLAGYVIGRIDRKVNRKLLEDYRRLTKTQREVIYKQGKIVMKCLGRNGEDTIKSIFDLVRAAVLWEEELKAQGIDPSTAKLEVPETER